MLPKRSLNGSPESSLALKTTRDIHCLDLMVCDIHVLVCSPHCLNFTLLFRKENAKSSTKTTAHFSGPVQSQTSDKQLATSC